MRRKKDGSVDKRTLRKRGGRQGATRFNEVALKSFIYHIREAKKSYVKILK